MKEIVIVTPHLGNGGAERVLTELMTAWTQTGVEVCVIQTNPNLYGKDYRFGQKVHVINLTTNGHSISGKMSLFSRLKQTTELIHILENHKNAVVLSFVNRAILICGLASYSFKNVLVLSERCDPNRSPQGAIRRTLRDLMFRRADICVFQTEMAKRHFPKRVQNRSTIIPNPINPELPPPYEGKRRKTIVMAAQLSEQKNLPMAICAFEKFHKDYPEYTLEIYGRGEKEEALRTLIHEKGLFSCAFLMGFSDDIYSKMIDCAMYVSSSDYEGISNSMLEALGMGVPCICTDCPVGGARETITDGENGLLVPVGDVDALYGAMVRIAGDPEFAERLSKNAVQIREKLDVHRIAAEWLKVMCVTDGE